MKNRDVMYVKPVIELELNSGYLKFTLKPTLPFVIP